MKLRQKLMLLSTLSKAVIAAVLLLALPTVVQTLALRHTDAAMRRELDQVRERIAADGVRDFLPVALDSGHSYYDLLRDEYIELRPADPRRLPTDTLATLARLQDGELVDFRVLRARLTYAGRPYVVEVGKSMASVEDVYGLLNTLAGVALLFAVGSTLLLELTVIQRLLRPVDHIVQGLRAVRGPQAPALPPLRTTTSDFQYLDDAIRQMLRSIEAVFEQERAFIANASHELLTPISILQNRFENMLQAETLPEEAETQLVASQRTLHRLTTTLRTLLLISRVENGQYARPDQVNVADVIAEVLEELEDRLHALDLRVSRHLDGAPVLPAANRSLLFTLFYNLLNNAAKYNEPGGRIDLRGAPDAAGGYSLIIHNTGPAIPLEQVPHVFERFRRAGAGLEEGHGLGLALVRTIADFHGIGVELTSGAEGTTVRLRWE